MNTETDTIDSHYTLCEAAPDLLAALEKCNEVFGASPMHCYQPSGEAISPLLIEIRAAIRKAKGDK